MNKILLIIFMFFVFAGVAYANITSGSASSEVNVQNSGNTNKIFVNGKWCTPTPKPTTMPTSVVTSTPSATTTPTNTPGVTITPSPTTVVPQGAPDTGHGL